MLTRDLAEHDIVLVSTSAGKDSQVMLDKVYRMAEAQGVIDRVVAVHCDLGRSEWSGTRALAQEQCDLYNVPMHVISRDRDLLHQVEFERKKWPSRSARYCTSDHKRDQANKVITQLVAAFNLKKWGRRHAPKGTPPVKVLLCIGLRAQESRERAQEPVFARDLRASSGVRTIDRWLPIHDWTEEQVWARIRETAMPYHKAYDLGMPRLSCVFCYNAPESALLIAGHHNRALLAEHVRIERAINHTFKYEAPLINIQAKLEAGYVPAGKVEAVAWMECGGGF
jgi:3'-phosphoadenosine 5'-phosphosulfate sulfotransferase (PAPS reductase)/FAD synthetase